MNTIPILDILFLILIVLMIIHGYFKGFISELFSWASLILAVFAAVSLYHTGASFIRTKMMQNVKYLPEILAFIIIFLIVILLFKMVEHVLKDVIKGARLEGVNKVLGLIFGIAEGIALVAIILFVLAIQPVFDTSKIIGESIFAQILLPLIKVPFNRGKEAINAAFHFLNDMKITGMPI